VEGLPHLLSPFGSSTDSVDSEPVLGYTGYIISALSTSFITERVSAELIQKQKELYKTGRPYRAPPVEGAPEGVRALHALGFCLVVVTTREKHEMDKSRQWLREHFDGTRSLAHVVERYGSRALQISLTR
jgi:phosphoglycolate phosphatase-like HAD superfamily hydrolase